MSASSAAPIAKMPSGASSGPGRQKSVPRSARRASPSAPPVRAAGPAHGRNPGCDRPVSRARSAPVSVAIVDYGSGNLHSAAKAFERARTGPGRPSDRRDQRSGSWRKRGSSCAAGCRRFRRLPPRAGRRRRDGGGARRAVRRKGRPFFGICVGMQLLAERGREYEVTEGLGWIAGKSIASRQ